MEFYWNDETIAHFELQSAYDSKDKVLKDVTSFVEYDCALEDGETEGMLIEDLMNKIYKTNTN